MDELKNALPSEGSLVCAQKRKLPEESMARYRRNLLLTLGFCLLLADALNWPAGTAAEDVKTAFRALGIFLK